MISSYVYLGLLSGSLAFLLGFLWLSRRTKTADSWHVWICVVMACIFCGELVREWHVFLTQHIPTVTYGRIVILRLEQTWFGLFLGEVMRYARKA